MFDEADSLFANRTQVKSSNDRHANSEVNYLIQRIEAFSGIAILTTNLPECLDDALTRRTQFNIHFPMPDAALRERLWKHLIPPESPCDEDIDFGALAEHFIMPGGHIKNAVFNAAVEASSNKTRITQDDLLDAALREYRRMGHVVRDETILRQKKDRDDR